MRMGILEIILCKLDLMMSIKSWECALGFCPTCRGRVHHTLATYRGRYKAQLQNRFNTFLLSGFCPKCIIWFMERDRNQLLPMLNENLEQMSGQMQTGNVYANISQGGEGVSYVRCVKSISIIFGVQIIAK